MLFFSFMRQMNQALTSKAFPGVGRETIKKTENLPSSIIKGTAALKLKQVMFAYLQVLESFQGPDGRVSEFDVIETLIRVVFDNFATGEPIPMLLSQRCHFYNWSRLATFYKERHGQEGVWAELTTRTLTPTNTSAHTWNIGVNMCA